MAETPGPAALKFDGENSQEVLAKFRAQHEDNPIVRGGVILEPTPGEPAKITVEHTDETITEIREGDSI
jgi:hypothetical protein